MDPHEIAHIKELSSVALEKGFLTASHFLRPEEIDDVRALHLNNVIFIGGHDDYERGIAVFLPDYLSAAEAMKNEAEDNQLICCMKIDVLGGRFAGKLTHRDFLGAILSLGVKREFVGDILFDKGISYAFVLSSIAPEIENGLSQAKHEKLSVERIPCSDCPAKVVFTKKELPVSSLRLDLAVASAFHLSREEAKRTIEGGLVMVGGLERIEPSTPLKEGMRISLKGHGKFIYSGVTGQSKKGKTIIEIAIYK